MEIDVVVEEAVEVEVELDVLDEADAVVEVDVLCETDELVDVELLVVAVGLVLLLVLVLLLELVDDGVPVEVEELLVVAVDVVGPGTSKTTAACISAVVIDCAQIRKFWIQP
mmetsp:Transcript_13302/g.31130  ORF Transcript_13302/g.31130 Transcript_13302/m.31130 type:complete len:112 (+) Transcript_13302:4298-4633(+)